jgi:hypothetical protein
VIIVLAEFKRKVMGKPKSAFLILAKILMAVLKSYKLG